MVTLQSLTSEGKTDFFCSILYLLLYLKNLMILSFHEIFFVDPCIDFLVQFGVLCQVAHLDWLVDLG